jgi:hypothetical protein
MLWFDAHRREMKNFPLKRDVAAYSLRLRFISHRFYPRHFIIEDRGLISAQLRSASLCLPWRQFALRHCLINRRVIASRFINLSSCFTRHHDHRFPFRLEIPSVACFLLDSVGFATTGDSNEAPLAESLIPMTVDRRDVADVSWPNRRLSERRR